MCKEGWFVGLGQEKRVAWMRGKLGQGVDSLKGEGGGRLEPPYELWGGNFTVMALLNLINFE